ncbi:MAG TPA: condensation domain-containing protein, partial [Bryobacteraceae bacterium]|nr:condensation domain-containing protein [Bryobacteraceae bacterium]
METTLKNRTDAASATRGPQGSREPGRAKKIPLERRQRPQRLPLSFAQQRLWFINKLRGASSEYNMPFGLHCSGELDERALHQGLNAVVARHESLRTRFEEIAGEAVQIVEPEMRIAMPVEDFTRLDEETKSERLREAMASEGATPFDLTRGPLLRVRLIKLREREYIFLETMHHVVSDGWSWGVFHRELMALYEAYRKGEESPLEELPLQYADYTLWQRDRLQSGALDQGIAYWKHQLVGLPERIELPADHVRGGTHAPRLGVCKSVVSSAQARALKQWSRENQATPYMTLMAAFGILLWRYSGEEDIAVGSPVANRPQPQLEGMIGVFVNTNVLRLRIRADLPFSRFLHGVKQTAWEAFQHQDVPFDRIVEELSPERSVQVTPLFQVLLAFQSMPWNIEQVDAALHVEPFAGDASQARFDLEVHVWDKPGGLEVRWLYNREIFQPWRIEQMAQHYTAILDSVLADSEQPLVAIDVFTSREPNEIVQAWAGEKQDFWCATLIEQFDHQVKETPEAIAVVTRNEQLTFAEVDRRANGLARRLRELGVQAEDAAGVALERSAEMVIAALAAWKAGAAYVPLDASYPVERLSFMLGDAGVKALFCREALGAVLRERHAGLATLDPAEGWPCEAGAAGGRRLHPANLAYVIYTSGS